MKIKSRILLHAREDSIFIHIRLPHTIESQGQYLFCDFYNQASMNTTGNFEKNLQLHLRS